MQNYLIVTLAIIGLTSAYICPQPTTVCQVNVDAPCAISDNVTQSTYECSYGLYCSDAQKCHPDLPLGTVCSESGRKPCGTNATCLPNDMGLPVCTAQFAYPGQACSKDGDCIFYSNTAKSSTNSTCVSGQCYGLKNGDACTTYHQCVSGSYCNGQQVCSPKLDEGAVCDVVNDREPCAAGLYCLPTSKNSSGYDFTCTKIYNGQKGDFCIASLMCGDNLACVNDTCSPIKSSLKSCDTLNDCADGESCRCLTPGSSSVCVADAVPTGGSADYQNLLTCFNKNPKCNVDSFCTECLDALCPVVKEYVGIADLCGLSDDQVQWYKNCVQKTGQTYPSVMWNRDI